MGLGGFSRSVLVGLALCTTALPAMATSTGPVTTLEVCDPDYYKTLMKKGNAEIQRELQVNTAVITKPASVLALSCFDNALTQAAMGGSTFSDSNGKTNTLKNAINVAVGDGLTSYYGRNFKEPLEFSGLKFTSADSLIECDRLQTLWNNIKYGLANDMYLESLADVRKVAADGKDIRGEDSSVAGLIAAIYTDGLQIPSDLAAGIVQYGPDYFDTSRPNFCAYDPKSGDALADGTICKVEGEGDKKCSDMNAVPTGVAMPYADPSATNASPVLVWTYTCLNNGCEFDTKANLGRITVSNNPTPPTGLKCSNFKVTP